MSTLPNHHPAAAAAPNGPPVFDQLLSRVAAMWPFTRISLTAQQRLPETQGHARNINNAQQAVVTEFTTDMIDWVSVHFQHSENVMTVNNIETVIEPAAVLELTTDDIDWVSVQVLVEPEKTMNVVEAVREEPIVHEVNDDGGGQIMNQMMIPLQVLNVASDEQENGMNSNAESVVAQEPATIEPTDVVSVQVQPPPESLINENGAAIVTKMTMDEPAAIDEDDDIEMNHTISLQVVQPVSQLPETDNFNRPGAAEIPPPANDQDQFTEVALKISLVLLSVGSAGSFAFTQAISGKNEKRDPTMKSIFVACNISFAVSFLSAIIGVIILLVHRRHHLDSSPYMKMSLKISNGASFASMVIGYGFVVAFNILRG